MTGQSDNPDEYFEQVGALIGNGAFSEALGKLNAEFEKCGCHPGNPLSLELREKFQDHYQNLLPRIESLADQGEIALGFRNAGLIYWWENKLNKALSCFQKQVDLGEGVQDPKWVVESLVLTGTIHQSQGDIDDALGCGLEALKVAEAHADEFVSSSAVGFTGLIYSLKGDLDRALEYFQRVLLLLEGSGDEENKQFYLHQIGRIFHQKGYLDRALEIYNENLNYYGKKTKNLGLAITLFHVIRIHIEMNDFENANLNLEKLRTFAEPFDETHLAKLHAKLATAVVLKKSPRQKNKFKAQELFQEIVETDTQHHDLKVFALLNYCDLLIFELQTFGNEEVIEEAKVITDLLLETAGSNFFPSLLVETYILKSKLALLELDLPSAQEFLSKSLEFTEARGFSRLARIIESEQETLQSQMNKWEELAEVKAPIRERIEKTKLENLLDRMINKRLTTNEEEVRNYAVIAKQLAEKWE